MGPHVDGAAGRPVGLGSPPHPVEALRRVGRPRAERLHLTVGGTPRVLPPPPRGGRRGECDDAAVLLSLRDYVEYWAERGVEVLGWTVNTAVEKEYYQNLLKIGFITDSLLEDCDPHY